MSEASERSNHDAPEMADVHEWHIRRLIAAWALALLMALAVAIWVPIDIRASWTVLAIGVSALLTFALQLGTAQKVGFITRVSFSVAGCVVIIAVVDAISFVVAAR